MGDAKWRRVMAGFVLNGLLLASALAAQSEGRWTDARSELNGVTFDFVWQKVADTFWEEDVGGLDWDLAGEELRPRALEAADDRELRRVLQELLSRLGQSHFGILPGPGSFRQGSPTSEPEKDGACTEALRRAVAGDDQSAGSDAGPGFEVRYVGSTPVVSRVVPGSAADLEGLTTGLEVVRVADQVLAALAPCLELDSLDPRVAASVRSDAVNGLLHGAPGVVVSVEFEDADGARTTYDLKREHHPDAVRIGFGNLPPMRYLFETGVLETNAGRVLTVRFNVWLLPVIQAFEAALYGDPAEGRALVDGLLIDLRGNPGGIAGTAIGVAGFLLGERVALGTMKNRKTELNLLVYPRRVSSAGARPLESFTGPVAVLIDGGSASTSEIFAAGLKDHGRGRLFGVPTAGAALPSIVEPMPNGDLLLHAVADFIRPGGERIEGRPVQPDSPVPLTREGLRAGRDEPREAALAWLASELLALPQRGTG